MAAGMAGCNYLEAEKARRQCRTTHGALSAEIPTSSRPFVTKTAISRGVLRACDRIVSTVHLV